MTRRRWCVVGMLAAVAMAAGPATPNAGAQEAAECKVKITAPAPGDQVGLRGKVRGTATIPPGTHLWVLAHMKDLAVEWWPQGGRPALVEPDGSWVIFAGYGGPQDVGEAFEVATVVVDDNTNRRLQQWVEDANETGDYPPIPFPTPVDACVPVKVVVEKVSH